MSEAPGSWAVILGVTGGTGAAVARQVARDPGLDVFGVHRGHHAQAAEAVTADVRANGRQVVLRVADAGTVEGALEGAEALLAAAGPRSVRLFVHAIASASLGRLASGGPDQLTPRQIAKTFDAMAHSFVYWTQQLAARDLLAPSARLVALTNPLHESLIETCGLIAATKGALEMYVRALALELGPRGHRVNLLKFPTVVTPAVRRVYGDDAMARTVAVHERLLPARRMCTVEEVARFVAVLAREEGEWFNGATIDFSGGMMLGLADLVLNPSSGGL